MQKVSFKMLYLHFRKLLGKANALPKLINLVRRTTSKTYSDKI